MWSFTRDKLFKPELLRRAVFLLLILPFFFPLAYAFAAASARLFSNAVLYQIFFPPFLKTLMFQALIELALILYFFLAARDKKYAPFFSATHLWLAAIFALLAITAWLSPDRYTAFFSSTERADGLIFLFHVGIYILLWSWIIKDRGILERVFRIMIFGGLATVAVTVLTGAFDAEHSLGSEYWRLLISQNLGNLNFAAHYLLILSLANAYPLLTKPRPLNVAVAAVFLLLLLLTLSASAILVALFVFAVLLWIVSRKVFYVGAFVALAALGYFLHADNKLVNQIFTLGDSFEVRWLVWRDAAVTIFKNRLWQGFGWDNGVLVWSFASRDSFAQFYPPSSQVSYDKMHNIIVEFLAAGGIGGALLIFWFWARLVFISLRRFIKSKERPHFFFFAAFSALFVYLQFNFDTLISYILVSPFIAGFVMTSSERRRVVNFLKKFWIACAAGSILFFGITAYKYEIKPFEAYFLRMRGEMKVERAAEYVNPPFDEISDALERALGIRQPYQLLAIDVFKSYYRLTDSISLSPAERARVFNALDPVFQKITARYPNPTYVHTLAYLSLQFAGDWEEAVRYLEKAVAMAPARGLYRYQLALAYFKLGKLDSAEKLFRQLASAGVFQGPVYLHWAVVDFQQGRLREGKIKVLSALAYHVPTGEEWDLLTWAYLMKADKASILQWYGRMMSFLEVKDALPLYARMLDLAQGIGNRELIGKLEDRLDKEGYIINRLPNGFKIEDKAR